MQKAEKRKDFLDKKEEKLHNDEEKLEKEYDISMRMFKNAQIQMDKAIADGDMMEIQVAREMISAATKKLESASKHREEQSKVRIEIGKKRKTAFEKLFKTAKKSK